MAFFWNSPLILLVSICNVISPFPPGGMTLSKRAREQPQDGVTSFILRFAVPLLNTLKVWLRFLPSNTVEKTWLDSSTWMIGTSPDCAEYKWFLQSRLIDRKKIRKNVSEMFFFMLFASNACLWGFQAYYLPEYSYYRINIVIISQPPHFFLTAELLSVYKLQSLN